MKRKSIFDIIKEKSSLTTDIKRIHSVLFGEKCIKYDYNHFTIKEYVDMYLFSSWNSRGHCVNLNEFLRELNHDEIYRTAISSNDESIILFLELCYNLWQLVEEDLINDKNVSWYGNFYFLKGLMDDCLSQINYKAYLDAEKECVLLIEGKPEITAVAEIVDEGLALDVIRYNHHSLQGDIEAKKAILLRFGSELEPKRKDLKALNSTIEDNIFYMLNNLNLRHNNRSKKDKNYKEYIAKMRKAKLEEWYDELYQEMLLAFLLLDDKDRQTRISELRDKINNSTQK